MKIQSNYQTNFNQTELKYVNLNRSKFNNNNYFSYNKSKKSNNSFQINFKGIPLYIVDGGVHAQKMKNFAKAISKGVDIIMCNVETNPKYPETKQLISLYEQLMQLNKKGNLKNTYIAIPSMSAVPILNLQDQYNSLMHSSIKLTPQNIKSYKPNLINFFKEIFFTQYQNGSYIKAMDSAKQQIEFTYPVIQEINKLVNKEANVFIPAGHPNDLTIKYFVKQKNIKPEFYNFLATGEDKSGKIVNLYQEIKDKNWYDFNLLALSDAHIVNLENTKGKDFLFSAYDSCVTERARGLYNLSPVRNGEKVIGYSYTDTITNQLPIEECSDTPKFANLFPFVGKKASEIVATPDETILFKNFLQNDKYNIPTNLKGKIYPIEKIFSEEEINKLKLDLQGNYVDSSLKLFFRKNHNGEIIFPKCDCEGSGKPSVQPMWGCCFAVFTSIAEKIKAIKPISKAYNFAEFKPQLSLFKNQEQEMIAMAENAYKKSDWITAESQYNKLLDKMSLYFKEQNLSLTKLKNSSDNKPIYKEIIGTMANIYGIIGDICKQKGNILASKVCKAAANDIDNYTPRGEQVISKRILGVHNIGDLYNEIKPN